MKRILTVLLTFSILLLSACKATKYKVTFDADGGAPVPAVQEVVKGKKAEKPADPAKDFHEFQVWSTVKGDLSKEFNFAETPIEDDITLYAVWREGDKSTVSFDSRGGGAVASVNVFTGAKVGLENEPANPAKEGYRFMGWFRTTYGGTWRDKDPVDFANYQVDDDVKFYAYWEPVNSKAVAYSPGETYKTAIAVDTAHYNPLTYTDNFQGSLFGYLSANFYSEEVDWDKAIAAGMADFEGDFSKFVDKNGEGGPYLTAALEPKLIMRMAAAWPVDADGVSYEDENGYLDIDLAKEILSISWTYKMREDLKFENGDPINADVYEYTLKQYLDPVQQNSRGFHVYEDTYLEVLNSKAYFDGEVDWDEVGYEKIDEYTFKITCEVEKSLKAAVDFVDMVTLINKVAYEASASETPGKYSYATPEYPFVSYGPYVLKEWSEDAKWVFNKNYDYFGKDTVMYKAIEMQVVAQEPVREQMFADGEINAFGLSANFFAKYINDESILSQPDQFTMGLSFNNNARGDEKEVPSIVADHDFRMAFFYGIDREDFCMQAAAPDVPTLGHLSDMHVSSLDDLTPYNVTRYHAEAIKDYSPETNGYLPEYAVELFDAAYARWVAAGNSGVVKLELVSRKGSTYYELMAAYIKSAYEQIFNKEGEPKRLEITLTELTKDPYDAAHDAHNYDITWNGWGGATALPGVWFLLYIYGNLAGGSYALEPGFGIPSLALEVDFSEFAAIVRPKIDTDDEKDWYEDFLDELDDDDVWKGTILQFYYYTDATIASDGKFEGKADVNFVAIQAVEMAILELMPVIPLTATASSTVYNDLQVDWANYCLYFGWGGQKYRFLKTDPDFASLLPAE